MHVNHRPLIQLHFSPTSSSHHFIVENASVIFLSCTTEQLICIVGPHYCGFFFSLLREPLQEAASYI